MAERQKAIGRVVAVQGPVVDVKFQTPEDVPNVFDVLETTTAKQTPVVLEVAEHLPGHVARCISMVSTLNIPRNASATPRGSGISVPVGHEMFGRIVNVLGQPIDRKGPLTTKESHAIRRPLTGTRIQAKARAQEPELLETGIKIIDLMFPMVKGSKNGILGGAALGKSVLTLELIHNMV